MGDFEWIFFKITRFSFCISGLTAWPFYDKIPLCANECPHKTDLTEEKEESSVGTEYYLVKGSALPEVLLKVVEAKRMLHSGEAKTVQEVAEKLGISRSSFYKYKDDIEPLAEGVHRHSVTISCVLQDQPGVLSEVLETVSDAQLNIQTIYQSVPTNGLAEISLNAQCSAESTPMGELLDKIREVKGVASVKLLARE